MYIYNAKISNLYTYYRHNIKTVCVCEFFHEITYTYVANTVLLRLKKFFGTIP